MENILPKIINPDQAGFVKSRYGTDNVRRALNVVQYLNTHKNPALIVSLDAKKAFDRVEWSFLFLVLEKFSLGSNFINMIKTFYSDPIATVNTNGLMSDGFPVLRGAPCHLYCSYYTVKKKLLFLQENAGSCGYQRIPVKNTAAQ